MIFHDGTLLDAELILFNFERIIQLDQLRRLSIISVIDHITTGSKFEITFHLNQPYSPFLSLLTNVYMMSPSGVDTNNILISPIGSGPYKYQAALSSDELFYFERNTNYFQGVPPFETVEMINYLGNEQREAFLNNQLDIFPSWGEEFNREDILIARTNYTAVNLMGSFNFNNPILADRKVRRALNHVVNQTKLNLFAGTGYGNPSTSDAKDRNFTLYSTAAPDVPKVDTFISQDKYKAEILLDQAGYPRNENGTRFSIDLLTSTERIQHNLSKLVVEDFEDIGIDVNFIPRFDWYIPLNKGEYDIFIFFRLEGSSLDPGLWEQFFGTNQPSNFLGYSNSNLDALYAEGKKTAIKNERYKIYGEILDLIIHDAPILQVASFNVLHNMKKSVSPYVSMLHHFKVIFTFEDMDEVIKVVEFSSGLTEIYSPRIDLKLMKDMNQEITVTKSNSIQEIDQNVQILGEEVSGLHIVSGQSNTSYLFNIYFGYDQILDPSSLFVYILKDNMLNEINFTSNNEFNYIQLEAEGETYLIIGKQALEIKNLANTQFDDGSDNGNDGGNETELSILLIIFGIIFASFALEQFLKAKKNSRKLIANYILFDLFIPPKEKLTLASIIGSIFAFASILLEPIFILIGILGLEKSDANQITSKPKICVDGELKQHDEDKKVDFRGKALDLYLYLISNPGFHGVRNIQKELNFSTPSLVYYHLNRLLKGNAISKTQDGKYGLQRFLDTEPITPETFVNFHRIIPRTIIIGTIFLVCSVTLIVIAIFQPSTLSWIIFLAPSILFLALFQFREAFNMVGKMSSQIPSEKPLNDMTYEEIQNNITKAISLKQSNRAKNIFDAQKILQNVLKQDKLNNELTIIALVNLCDILIHELRIKQEETILVEAEELTQRIKDLADGMGSIILSVDVLIIQSKFDFVKGDFEEGMNKLREAETIASEDKFLVDRITKEYNAMNQELERYLKQSKDKSITDKLEKLKIQDYLDDVLKTLDQNKLN